MSVVINRTVDNIGKSVDNIANTTESWLRSDYAFAFLAIIAITYGRYAAPRLPDWLMRLMSNDFFRVILLSLLLVLNFESRPTVAIIVALAFVVIFDMVLHEKTLQHFENMENTLYNWMDNRIDDSEKLAEAVYKLRDRIDDKKLENIVNQIKSQNSIMA